MKVPPSFILNMNTLNVDMYFKLKCIYYYLPFIRNLKTKLLYHLNCKSVKLACSDPTQYLAQYVVNKIFINMKEIVFDNICTGII